jgi:hypothetical protein
MPTTGEITSVDEAEANRAPSRIRAEVPMPGGPVLNLAEIARDETSATYRLAPIMRTCAKALLKVLATTDGKIVVSFPTELDPREVKALTVHASKRGNYPPIAEKDIEMLSVIREGSELIFDIRRVVESVALDALRTLNRPEGPAGGHDQLPIDGSSIVDLKFHFKSE